MSTKCHYKSSSPLLYARSLGASGEDQGEEYTIKLLLLIDPRPLASLSPILTLRGRKFTGSWNPAFCQPLLSTIFSP